MTVFKIYIMKEEYRTVRGQTENLIVIERSKFICYIKGVENEGEAKNFIAEIRKKNSLATHNCYAYIADEKGLVQKFSDDGEPQGTAGLPMLEVLKNRKIFKTAAVVTRYFGGVKLGAGGLTRAYGSSVSDCLDKAEIITMSYASFVSVCIEYDKYLRLLKLANENAVICETRFSLSVEVDFAVKIQFSEKFFSNLSDMFGGNVKAEVKSNGYYPFQVNDG